MSFWSNFDRPITQHSHKETNRCQFEDSGYSTEVIYSRSDQDYDSDMKYVLRCVNEVIELIFGQYKRETYI